MMKNLLICGGFLMSTVGLGVETIPYTAHQLVEQGEEFKELVTHYVGYSDLTDDTQRLVDSSFYISESSFETYDCATLEPDLLQVETDYRELSQNFRNTYEVNGNLLAHREWRFLQLAYYRFQQSVNEVCGYFGDREDWIRRNYYGSEFVHDDYYGTRPIYRYGTYRDRNPYHRRNHRSRTNLRHSVRRTGGTDSRIDYTNRRSYSRGHYRSRANAGSSERRQRTDSTRWEDFREDSRSTRTSTDRLRSARSRAVSDSPVRRAGGSVVRRQNS